MEKMEIRESSLFVNSACILLFTFITYQISGSIFYSSICVIIGIVIHLLQRGVGATFLDEGVRFHTISFKNDFYFHYSKITKVVVNDNYTTPVANFFFWFYIKEDDKIEKEVIEVMSSVKAVKLVHLLQRKGIAVEFDNDYLQMRLEKDEQQ